MEEAKEFVIKVLGEEKAEYWWKTENPSLGGLIPDYLIAIGREKKLLQFIECAKEDWHE